MKSWLRKLLGYKTCPQCKAQPTWTLFQEQYGSCVINTYMLSAVRYYLVSYGYDNGFGRKLLGTNGPIDADCIVRWEATIAELVGPTACILALSPIDGPIGGDVVQAEKNHD